MVGLLIGKYSRLTNGVWPHPMKVQSSGVLLIVLAVMVPLVIGVALAMKRWTSSWPEEIDGSRTAMIGVRLGLALALLLGAPLAPAAGFSASERFEGRKVLWIVEGDWFFAVGLLAGLAMLVAALVVFARTARQR